MASRPLTVKAIDALKPAAARLEIPDGAMPGLYLIVQPSGAKSWAVRYRLGQRTRKMTLGPLERVTLADARKAALDALDVAAEGRDPAIEARDAVASKRSSSNAAEELLEEFVRRHVSKQRSAVETTRIIEKHLKPAWRGRAIRTIGPADVLAVVEPIADDGKGYLANRVFATARKFLNWNVERRILPMSPIVGMRPPAAEESRQRVLADWEIRALWQACDRIGWPWGDFAKLLLLTAQRREEVAGAPRSEFDLESKSPAWLIPASRAKNGEEHLVPLAPAVVEIIRGIGRVEGPGDFLLSTNGESPISGFAKGKARIDAAMLEVLREADPNAVLTPWRFHDLRRTAASGLQKLKQPIHVVEAVLNHKSGTVSGVAAIYGRYDYAAEKRAALVAWAKHVKKLCA
jgi:integrase